MFAPSPAAMIRCRAMMPWSAFAIAIWSCVLSTKLVSAQANPPANSNVGSLLGTPSVADDPFPEIATLEAQVKELATRPDAPLAAPLLKIAQTALHRARVLSQQGDREATERSKQIAWAAIAAASHTLARHHAAHERDVAERRKQLAMEAADAARSALAHARSQQAAARATTPAAVTPAVTNDTTAP